MKKLLFALVLFPFLAFPQVEKKYKSIIIDSVKALNAGSIDFKDTSRFEKMVSVNGILATDSINEFNPAAGVLIDGVKIKDNNLTATIIQANTSVVTDVINEKTVNAGVTVDGVLIKDGDVITSNDKVIKAASGGGQLDLRVVGTNNVVGLTTDNGIFQEGFYLGTNAISRLGFGGGLDASTPVAAVECEDKSIIMRIRGADGQPNTQVEAFKVINVASGDALKIGFFGVTPVGKPILTNDIKNSLASLGLITGGGATPLNLDGGTLTGNTTASGTLTLQSTSNVTKGKILFGTSAYDEVNNRLGIGTTTPSSILHIKATIPGTVGSHPAGQLIIQNPADDTTANVVITAYESDGSGDPDQQLWYLGNSSSGDENIILLNRRDANLDLGTNGISFFKIENDGDIVLFDGTADKDFTLTFNGETNDGIITYMEDEDRFDVDNDFKVSGDLTVAGNIGIFGTQGFADSSVTIAMTQNIFYKITNPSSDLYATGINIGDLVFTGDSIQVVTAGHYEISYDLSFSGANQDKYHLELFVNNVEQSGKGETERDMSISDVGVSAASTILNIGAGQWVALKIKNVQNDNDATLKAGNITVKKL